MNIGILGAGNVGVQLARLLGAKGHSVALSFSRDPLRLNERAVEAGVVTTTPADAVGFAEVVVLATPYVATTEVFRQVGKAQSKRILWDCTTPFAPDFSGLLIGTSTSAAEEYAKSAPWASVVKAVPPFAQTLKSGNMMIDGERLEIFVCSDDSDARRVVMDLVADIGAAPVDVGPLAMSRFIEPMNMFLIALAYRQGLGTRITFRLYGS